MSGVGAWPVTQVPSEDRMARGSGQWTVDYRRGLSGGGRKKFFGLVAGSLLGRFAKAYVMHSFLFGPWSGEGSWGISLVGNGSAGTGGQPQPTTVSR